MFTISGKHIEITEALKAHAEEKVAKLPKFYNMISHIEVIIDGSDGGDFEVELIARAEHSNVFVVTEKGDDAYACIDVAVHKLERQLRKKKEKQRNNKHLGTEKPGPDLSGDAE